MEQSWLQGEVEIVEDLGSDRFVHVKCDALELIARTGRESSVKRGDPVGLNIASGQLHVFKDGMRFDV
jgi:ABC-type sugar transport system ATPase subunit